MKPERLSVLAKQRPGRRGGARVVAPVVTSLALAAASAAHAAFPGRDGKIALSGGFGCGYDRGAIASMNPDGTELRVLTACDIFTFAPNWSPDGRSLLFTTYRNVWQMAADGSGRGHVSLGSAPSFAPDGRHYAYLRGPSFRKDIRRAALDGRGDRLLRRGRYPLWSPNGRTIAYSDRKGVWIMSSRTGKRLRRVASPRHRPVDWSPDGRRLLCVRYWQRFMADVQSADLFVVRVDGTGSPRRLTRTRRRSEYHAAWSPSGRRIVFSALSVPSEFQHQRSIWTMSVRGTREKRIWEEPPYAADDEDRVAESAVSLSWQPLTD